MILSMLSLSTSAIAALVERTRLSQIWVLGVYTVDKASPLAMLALTAERENVGAARLPFSSSLTSLQKLR